MRPSIEFLDEKTKDYIKSEALLILEKLGVEIHNDNVLKLLKENRIKVDEDHQRAYFTETDVENALKTTPYSFKLYNTLGKETHNFRDNNVYFTPGSTALTILDYDTNKIRKCLLHDYINYGKHKKQCRRCLKIIRLR